jgi:hypothetical protein
VTVEERDGVLWADIYWNDLTTETQAELFKLMGDNGNYDVFPIGTINVSPESD